MIHTLTLIAIALLAAAFLVWRITAHRLRAERMARVQEFVDMMNRPDPLYEDIPWKEGKRVLRPRTAALPDVAFRRMGDDQ